MSDIFIGIDPGVSGAICFMNSSGKIEDLCFMPIIKVGKKSEVDLSQELIDKFSSCKHIFIEKANPFRPRTGYKKSEGVVSTATSMKNYGILIGCFKTLKKPYTEIAPRTWKSEMLKGVPDSDDKKDRSRFRARQLWPNQDFRLSTRRKKDHDGLCEAALIARYGLNKISF